MEQSPLTRDKLLAKQQLVKKGVDAFTEASDEEVEKFREIPQRDPSPKVTTKLVQLFNRQQNTTRSRQ